MKKVELLAPAGNFDCLKAAINNGANAVYLGGKNFSARAFANNFDEQELIEAVKYAHLRNVKVYVTLNTLLNEKQFNNAIKMAEFYYKNNVDALLIQDLGLYYYLKTNFPDFELHCSTQMHIHNIEGIRTAKKMGFKRVVVARESNLDFIKEATKQGIEIETFVHGAICVSYSGQCLMSSVTKNRSANKGMCAQCCRLKYNLYIDGDKLDLSSEYPISPKDMCLINDIPSLIDAGVSSFKIEGRLKSAAYVGYVTSLYRKAIDYYYENKEYKISDEELDNLKVLFNRNFTNDYLFNRNNLFGQKTPNHLGIEIGDAFKYENGLTYIKLSKVLNQFDGIRINDFGCIINMLYKNDLLINSGHIGDIVAIKTDEELIGKVYKTLDYEFEMYVNSKEDIKLPINIKVIANKNEKVKVILKLDDVCYEYLSSIECMEAKNAPLDINTITNQFSKLNDTEYYLNSIELQTDNAFLPVKMINSIRRDSIESFDKYRLSLFKRTINESKVEYSEPKYDEDGDICLINDIAKNRDNEYKLNYVINIDSIYSNCDNQINSELGGLLNKSINRIAYYTLNCSNSYCYEFFKKLGYDSVILSTELNSNDIEDLKQAYKDRNDVEIKPYVLDSGSRVLMYIKSDPFKINPNSNDKYILKDLNNEYIVTKRNNITEITENHNSNINKQMFIIFK